MYHIRHRLLARPLSKTVHASDMYVCILIKAFDRPTRRNSEYRVPRAQGKQGKWPKNNHCKGKHREFGNVVKTQGKHREFCLNTGKTQGILLAQVVNVLILKVKYIAIVAAKKSIFFQKLDRSAKSVLCM